MGARLRRDRRAPGRRGVGREGGVPLADRRGGGQDRALLVRLLRPGVARRPHRPHPPGRPRGAVLGRRRHRPRDLRLGPRRGRHRRHRHPRAGHGVGAPVLRHPRQDPARRLLRVRARRRLGRQLAEDPGRLRRGQGRVGAQRHQGVDHQRRHRRRPRRRGQRRPRAQGARPGQLHHPARHQGPQPGPEVRSTASGPPTAESCSTTCARPPAARRRRSSTKLARAASGAPAPRSRRWPPSTRPAVSAMAMASPAAYEYALAYAKEGPSASRSS